MMKGSVLRLNQLVKALFACLLIGILVISPTADAAKRKNSASTKKSTSSRAVPKKKTAPAPAPEKKETTEEKAVSSLFDGVASSICIEADTGLVLSEYNADEQRPAASMVKMMLFLLVSEGLQDGRWALETPITVTEHAQSMGGSQVQLKAGEVFTLDQLMHAVAVASANDAATAVAEGLWGSTEEYLLQSNKRAQELGMIDSHFRSVNGLPPSAGQLPDQTTARDIVILAQWCVRHPRVMEWAGTKELAFRPGEHAKSNTNQLLSMVPGCDGLKTGFTRAAGWCVTATAARDGVRLLTVVMGGVSSSGRFRVAANNLEYGFASVRKVRLIAKGDPIEVETHVKNCETTSVRLTASDDLWAIIKADDIDKLALNPQVPDYIQAPVQAGTSIGEVRAELPGKILASVPLTVPQELAEAGWRWKLKNSVLRGVGKGS